MDNKEFPFLDLHGLTFDPNEATRSGIERFYRERDDKKKAQDERLERVFGIDSERREEWSALAFAAGFDSPEDLSNMFEKFRGYAPDILNLRIQDNSLTPEKAIDIINQKKSIKTRDYINRMDYLLNIHHIVLPPEAQSGSEWVRLNRSLEPPKGRKKMTKKQLYEKTQQSNSKGTKPPQAPESIELFFQMIDQWRREQ